MELDKYLIPAQEGYIFNKQDYQFNLNLWRPGKYNVLYITGLSGGAKSTTAKEYSEKYNAKHVELDIIHMAYFFLSNPNKEEDYKDTDDIKMLLEYYHLHPFPDPKTMDDHTYMKLVFDVFEYMVNQMHKNKNTLYVVEGIQLIPLARERFKEEIFNSPLIVKNTSILTALMRRAKRDGKKVFNVNGSKDVPITLKSIMNLFVWYTDQEYSLNCFRKDARNING